MNFNVILFNDFESLDVFGPIEVIGKLEKFFQIEYYSERGGIVRNLKATTNKMAFDWVREQDKEVQWIRKARWVNDGKYYTSSGVSAGIDMALGFVKDMLGIEVAEKISKGIEYIWNKDNNNDPFC